MPPLKEILWAHSKIDEVVRPTPAWLDAMWNPLACPPISHREKYGSHLGQAWNVRPQAIDVDVLKQPDGVLCSLHRVPIALVRSDFWRAVSPHLDDAALAGSVTLQGARVADYVSIVIRPERAIDDRRGPGASHKL